MLAHDNKSATRETTYVFQYAEEKVTLSYKVNSKEDQLEKICSHNNSAVSCNDFYKTYGAIELIPNW
jgi:hypothetical protein